MLASFYDMVALNAGKITDSFLMRIGVMK